MVGVRQMVLLSIIAAPRLPTRPHDVGKLAQERVVVHSGLPSTIVRAAHYFESGEMMVGWRRPGNMATLENVRRCPGSTSSKRATTCWSEPRRRRRSYPLTPNSSELVAEGTQDAPIRFESKDGARGAYREAHHAHRLVPSTGRIVPLDHAGATARDRLAARNGAAVTVHGRGLTGTGRGCSRASVALAAKILIRHPAKSEQHAAAPKPRKRKVRPK